MKLYPKWAEFNISRLPQLIRSRGKKLKVDEFKQQNEWRIRFHALLAPLINEREDCIKLRHVWHLSEI